MKREPNPWGKESNYPAWLCIQLGKITLAEDEYRWEDEWEDVMDSVGLLHSSISEPVLDLIGTFCRDIDLRKRTDITSTIIETIERHFIDWTGDHKTNNPVEKEVAHGLGHHKTDKIEEKPENVVTSKVESNLGGFRVTFPDGYKTQSRIAIEIGYSSCWLGTFLKKNSIEPDKTQSQYKLFNKETVQKIKEIVGQHVKGTRCITNCNTKRNTDEEKDVLQPVIQPVNKTPDKVETEVYTNSETTQEMCPYCKSKNFVKDGHGNKGKQKYECKNDKCGMSFVHGSKGLGRGSHRHNQHIKDRALKLDELGMSSRKISERLMEEYEVATSHVTITRWIKKKDEPETGIPEAKPRTTITKVKFNLDLSSKSAPEKIENTEAEEKKLAEEAFKKQVQGLTDREISFAKELYNLKKPIQPRGLAQLGYDTDRRLTYNEIGNMIRKFKNLKLIIAEEKDGRLCYSWNRGN